MEQAAVKRPGVLELTAKAWRSSLGALLGLSPLLALVAAALFGLNYLFPLLEQKLAVIRPASGSVFVLMAVPGAWVFALEKLVMGLAAAPAALATQRRVLVEDGTSVSAVPLLRYWVWAAAVLALSLGALYLAGLAAAPEVQLVSLVLKGFAIVIPLLLLPVFPGIAAGEPAANFAARMDKALERWDGNVWRFLIVMALTVGPALLLQRLPEAVIQRRGGAADAAQKFDATLVGSAVHSVLTVLLIVVAAAAMAWCYEFAKLPKPARKPLGEASGDVKPAPPK